MADWIGKTLGKVRIELLLARGGMAEVYLGTHTTLQRPVAVKLMRHQYQDDPEMLQRFEREARVVARLRHPNIVQVFDFDTVNGQPYLVMEYVPGVSLSTYLRALHEQGKHLDLRQASKLMIPLGEALQYAHDMGVIHRDVKPGNILLNARSAPVERDRPLPPDVQPVLTDFGLVRFINSTYHTATGQIAGTPAYMSPEQARGEKTDARTDIYSLGIVLYEILAGRVPFEADTTMGVLLKHISDAPRPIPGLAPPAQHVIDRALEKKPEDRFQTATGMARAFQVAVQDRSEAPTRAPTGSVLQQQEITTRRRREAIGRRLPVFLSIGAVVAVAAFFLLRPPATLNATPTPTSEHTHASETALPVIETGSTALAVTQGKTLGLLRFDNAAAILDEATFTALDMPTPPSGKQYEAWLLGDGGESRRSIGTLELDNAGKGVLRFVDEQGRNLIERYDTLELTIEPRPDVNPNPTGDAAFTVMLPDAGLLHVRHLLVSFASTPNKIGLVHGLLADAQLLDRLAQEMLAAQQKQNEGTVRDRAEAMLNVLVGDQSPDYRDWNNDGTVEDPGDGFGLLLNGENLGYIEGSFSHASYAATAPNTTQNMIVHGVHVEICTQNMEQWAPDLRDLLKQIVTRAPGSDLGPSVRQAVALTDELLNGTDLNGNEQVEPIPGEGGALTAFQHAYYMADITIYGEAR